MQLSLAAFGEEIRQWRRRRRRLAAWRGVSWRILAVMAIWRHRAARSGGGVGVWHKHGMAGGSEKSAKQLNRPEINM